MSGWYAVAVASALLIASNAEGQLEGLSTPPEYPRLSASLSGGVLLLHPVEDGPSSSKWTIDNVIDRRLSLEFSIARYTMVAVTHGRAPVSLLYRKTRFDEAIPLECMTGCNATADYSSWTAAIRGISGPGFHFAWDFNVGITELSNFREERQGVSLAPFKGDTDWTMMLGTGGGWSPGRRLQITLMADVGFAIHTRSGEQSRFNRMNWQTGGRVIVRSGLFP